MADGSPQKITRAAGPEDAGELGGRASQVGNVVEDGVTEHEVEGLVVERQLLGVGLDRLDVERRAARRWPEAR